MNTILLFGMPGGAELFFIVLVIIMLFGSKKIPELARGLGKGIKEIKNATGDIQKEIREGARDINNIKDKVNVEKQVKDLISEDKERKSSEAASKTDTENTESKTSEPKTEEPINQTQTVKRRSPYDNEDPQNSTENV